jgi:phosphoglycerate kinase
MVRHDVYIGYIYLKAIVATSGPMGIFEDPEFSHGTREVLKFVEHRTSLGCTTVICGGDTVSAAEQYELKNFTHVSMGGGAALELLGGKTLPGVEILNQECSTGK